MLEPQDTKLIYHYIRYKNIILTNPRCTTDANGDGYTNVADLLVVLGAFGTECE